MNRRVGLSQNLALQFKKEKIFIYLFYQINKNHERLKHGLIFLTSTIRKAQTYKNA